MRRVWQTKGLAGGALGEIEEAGEVAGEQLACQEEEVKLFALFGPGIIWGKDRRIFFQIFSYSLFDLI